MGRRLCPFTEIDRIVGRGRSVARRCCRGGRQGAARRTLCRTCSMHLARDRHRHNETNPGGDAKIVCSGVARSTRWSHSSNRSDSRHAILRTASPEPSCYAHGVAHAYPIPHRRP